MGDHFKVELGDLDRLLHQLGSAQDTMRAALTALESVDPKATGSVELDNACAEFHDSWDNAIKKIADGTEQIEQKLRATKNNYQATEQAIYDAISKGAAGSRTDA